MFYKDLEKRKELVRKFIRRNPKTTYRDLRKMGIKVDKVYKGKMAEAFKDAGLELPRTFKAKTKEEKRKVIIDYIRKYPMVGGHTIRKDTKINFLALFKNTKNAFDSVGVEYPREVDDRLREEKKKEIIGLVKVNPMMTISEIIEQTKTNFYNFFRSLDEVYDLIRIKRIRGHDKWAFKKKKEVIGFIKKNPFSTQREINKACKTHVQRLFERGIFEAFELAKVVFPYERLKLYGVGVKNIRDRARNFEEAIATKLSGYGKVNRLVRTKRGFADVVFERKGRKVIIEIKDYRAKEISIAQVKQLNKYLEDFSCNLGILICHEKPRKDKFLIGKNRIFIVEESEFKKIPLLIDREYGSMA